ncbi:MAG: hydrogenase maturation protease [Thermoplasmata archaeon]
MNKILVIGIGNPILGDDGLGIHAVRSISEECKGYKNLSFKEASIGGLGILEEILDYDKVIIIDAMVTGKHAVGEIKKLKVEDFSNTKHSTSPHDINFATALEIGKRSMPERIPKEISIYAVEVGNRNIYNFSEELSPEIKESVKKVAKFVKKEIEEECNKVN